RSGLTVLVSLIGRSFLSEVERPSILRTELPVAPWLSYRLATRPLGSRPPPAQRAGAERLRALAPSFRTGTEQERALWVEGGRSPTLERPSQKGGKGPSQATPCRPTFHTLPNVTYARVARYKRPARNSSGA